MANTLNHLSVVQYSDKGFKFGQAHNKVGNILTSLHPLRKCEIVDNLEDYSLIAKDLEILTTLKEGLKVAQVMLWILNMVPSSQASAANKLWFVSPWKLEKEESSQLAYQPPQIL